MRQRLEMSEIYDNWERLVAAALKKQELWELFHAPSRTPSTLSEASDFSSTSWHQEDPPNLVLLSDFSLAIDVKDLRMASAELLGKGTFGSTYSATTNNGAKILVKKLKLGTTSELDFRCHMDVVGSIRRRCVAPLRAYYAFGNERALLYDYYNEGSLYSLLHGQTGENRAQVSWRTRQTVAINVARAIAEIHNKTGGKLVHGNIKATNIFLHPKLCCHVSDLGLANIVETTFMPNARCYAPEVKTSKNVSQASDVYSFGVLLLELLTRKSFIQVPGGPKAVDLVKPVLSAKVSEVLDGDLIQYSTASDKLVGMLQVGVKCVTKSVKKRPTMSQVVKMLEDIFELNSISYAPEEKRLVFLDDANPRFGFEEVMTASYEVIGQGSFGTSYKAILETGNVIVMKRLKDAVDSFHTFQQQMGICQRMKHDNVENIMAYYFSADEKLVLYHYYGETSISALLHGRGDVVLDWKTRCNIALDAARGIAHIHSKDGAKLVHGNIKSSNTFLDGNYTIVSGGGCSKLANPIKLTGKRHPGYNAPEVMHTWHVSQASDVYSFGVLLLELVSGLSVLSWHRVPNGDKMLPLVEWFRSISRHEWIVQVVDTKLLRYRNREKWDAGIVRVLEIARDCVNTDPELRPGMHWVVKMLEEINENIPSVRSKWKDVDGEVSRPSIETRLEILCYLLTTMNKPTFRLRS